MAFKYNITHIGYGYSEQSISNFLFDLSFSLMFCEDVFSMNANDYDFI